MPNHAPLPVLEEISPALPVNPGECETLKVRYGIETDQHKNNIGRAKKKKLKEGRMTFSKRKTSGRTTKKGKPIPESSFYQSHHVHQDFAMDGLISRGAALAVMLYDNLGNSEHGRITSIQNERARNKGQGPCVGPARNYGQLRACSRWDTEQGLRADRKRTGMTKQDANKLATCIEEEAHKSNSKAFGTATGKPLKNSTPVAGAGCFAAGTLIWLPSGPTRADEISIGAEIQTREGPQPVIRIDRCMSDFVTLAFWGWTVDLAPFHRVQLADGRLKRVSALTAGERLATAAGHATLRAVLRRSTIEPLYSFGLSATSEAFVGGGGLVVELPRRGPPQTAEAPLHNWLSYTSGASAP